jgi:hypothetical protein
MGDGLGRVKGSNGPSDMVDSTRVVEGKEVKEKEAEVEKEFDGRRRSVVFGHVSESD